MTKSAAPGKLVRQWFAPRPGSTMITWLGRRKFRLKVHSPLVSRHFRGGGPKTDTSRRKYPGGRLPADQAPQNHKNPCPTVSGAGSVSAQPGPWSRGIGWRENHTARCI